MKRLSAIVLAAFGLLAFSSAAQAALSNGVITVYVTVQVNTPIPTGDSVICELVVSVDDASGINTETVVSPAVLSGNIATCTLAIPYYWELSTPGTDPVSIEYNVGILPSNYLTVQQGVRYGTHSLPPLTGVPANGTHTNINAPTARL